MDIRQQLQRLLDLTEEARRHVQELYASRTGALSELDAAEYDLRRLIDDISSLLPDRVGPVDTAGPRRRAG